MSTKLNAAAVVLAAAALCAMSAGPALAAAPVPSPSPSASLKTLDAIVVTAQRHAERIRKTPRQTFVLTSAELERLGARTVADALRYSAGTVVQQYGPLGSLATVALRGASTSETLVLINGRPVNEADTGLFDFSSLPASVVDRVEVVEGGSSTLYGSAALGGVINIITKQPGSAAQHSIDAYLASGYEGAFERGFGASFGDERRVALRVDAESNAANNVFNYPAFTKLEAGGVRGNDDATLKHTALSLAHLFGTIRGALTWEDDAAAVGAPGSVDFASAFARQERVYQRAALDLDASLPAGEVSLQAYADSRRLRFFDPSFQFDTHANGTFRGASVRITQSLGTTQLVTAGWESKGDVALFDASIPGKAPSVVRDATAAWYVQDELHRPNAPLGITIGLRNERIQGTKSTTTPSLGVLEHLGSHLDASANYARAFRAPSLDERYYPFYGNPSVQPEYGATFDAGLRADSGSASAALTWFGADTNNLIVNVPIDTFGDVTPFNVNRARVRGLAGNLATSLDSRTHLTIAYTDFIVAQDLTPGRPATRLQYRPTASGGVVVWHQARRWNFGAQGAFVGKRFADEANTRLMPAYFLTSAYVERALSANTSLELRVTNLSDNRLAEDELGYPIPGRALWVRLAAHY